MSNNSSIILAVDPGSRELGVAVVNGGELLFYGVKTISNHRNPQRILEAVSHHMRRLVNKYRPAHLAIEKTRASQQNFALLATIADQFKAIATEANLLISEYTSANVRKRLCQSGRATRRETARVLAERFPELGRYYLRATKWERDYYGNLFDAVAIGVICEEDIMKNDTAQIREDV